MLQLSGSGLFVDPHQHTHAHTHTFFFLKYDIIVLSSLFCDVLFCLFQMLRALQGGLSPPPPFFGAELYIPSLTLCLLIHKYSQLHFF